MATSTTLTLSDIIEEAMSLLYRPIERPLQFAVGADAITSTSDASFQMAADNLAVQVSSLLEVERELMLVTAKDSSSPPVLTVERGYAGTGGVKVASAPTGTTVLVRPLWARNDVYRAILRCFSGSLATHLPSIDSVTKTLATGAYYVSMPANTIDILRVGMTEYGVAGTSQADAWEEVGQWELIEDVPTTVVSTGKMLTLPRWLPVGQEFHVTYQIPYAWSGGTDVPAETETISVPSVAVELPALYAAAHCVLGREISRLELDRIEEWNQEAAIRQGVNLRLATQLWNEFYRRLDEARRVQNLPRRRPYRAMKVHMGGRWNNGFGRRRGF